MNFIKDYMGEVDLLIEKKLLDKNSISHKANFCSPKILGIHSDLIADCFPKIAFKLFADSASQFCCCKSPGFAYCNACFRLIIKNKLRDLGGLATACLAADDYRPLFLDG